MGILAATLKKRHLNSDQFESISRLVRERILSVSTPQIIYIFGSYARGLVSESSDLDIAIIFEKPEEVKEQKKRILNGKLFLDYSTDCLFFSKVDFEKKAQLGGVCLVIKAEGKIIYDQRTKV